MKIWSFYEKTIIDLEFQLKNIEFRKFNGKGIANLEL